MNLLKIDSKKKKKKKKKWKGIDEKSRNGEYYPVAYAIHMLLLYKYDYNNKKIGNALFYGIDEQKLLEVFKDMEKVGIERKLIHDSIEFAEKVYNKLKED